MNINNQILIISENNLRVCIKCKMLLFLANEYEIYSYTKVFVVAITIDRA